MRKLRDLSFKNCPECQRKVGIALKSCKCGFNFTRNSTRIRKDASIASTSRSTKHTQMGSRRTRASIKPNFYDSQEFEKKKKGSKKQPTRATSAKATILNKQQNEKDDKSKDLREARAKQRRIKKEEIEDVDLANNLTADKQELAKIILAEINRKLGSVIWQPTI